MPTVLQPIARLLRAVMALLAAACLSACAAMPDADDSAEPAAASSMSLFDEQLLDIIARQQALDADAAQADARSTEIQRRFHQIARDYNLLISRSPRNLEARLLYGKFLANYGDADGAVEQFLVAARIDPNVAVIHQQLGTYYAENNDITRALAYYLNAVQLEPDNAAYHFGLGQLLAAFRQDFISEEVLTPERLDADLIGAFRKAAFLEPSNFTFQMRYGEAFLDVADPDWQAALAHWQSLAANDLPPATADVVRLHSAYVHIQLGNLVEAAALASDVTSAALIADADALLRSIQEQEPAQ